MIQWWIGETSALHEMPSKPLPFHQHKAGTKHVDDELHTHKQLVPREAVVRLMCILEKHARRSRFWPGWFALLKTLEGVRGRWFVIHLSMRDHPLTRP